MTPDADTPDDLVRFFKDLAPEGDPGGAGEVLYASPTVVRKGLVAARRLLEVQRALAGESSLPLPSLELSSDAGGGSDEELLEARAELDSMLMQNMELGKENKALKDRVAKLEERIERLYNMRELKTTLSQISSASAGGEPPPPRPMTAPRIKDEFEVESAARVPDEEREEENGDAAQESDK